MTQPNDMNIVNGRKASIDIINDYIYLEIDGEPIVRVQVLGQRLGKSYGEVVVWDRLKDAGSKISFVGPVDLTLEEPSVLPAVQPAPCLDDCWECQNGSLEEHYHADQ